jgi:hypothetical protein
VPEENDMTAPHTTDARPVAGQHASPRPGGPNGWLVLGGIVTALLIAAGTLTVIGWLGYRTETQRQVYDQTATSIDLDISTGDLTLVPGEPGEVVVTRRLYWSYSKPTIDERWDGQTLRVTGDCRGWWIGPGCGVDYTLEVPEGVAVRAQTSTGDVTVRNIRGALQLTTSTGDISVTGATGALKLRTSTGDIRATDLTSSTVDASASTGDIMVILTAAPQSVAVRTSTGDIDVFVPTGQTYRVQTEVSTGDVRVGVRQSDDASRSITARTSTGDIDIHYT